MTNPFREDVVYKYQYNDGLPCSYSLYKFKYVKISLTSNFFYAIRTEFKDGNLNSGITITDATLISLKEIDQYKPYAIEIRGAYYKIK